MMEQSQMHKKLLVTSAADVIAGNADLVSEILLHLPARSLIRLSMDLKLSKFVGETEKNVRDLFADAEQDQKTKGDQSELHVIIFDEIDAICKSRGSTRDGTGVHDSIVNQLLTKKVIVAS